MTKHITKEMLNVANMPDTPIARKVLARMLDDDDIQDYVRPWVGLTDEEQGFVYGSIHEAPSQPIPWPRKPFWIAFADAIEAKLKEKNHG